MPARVSTRSVSVRRLRFSATAGRYLVWALAATGILAAGRSAIAPPTPILPPRPAVPRVDLAADAFAVRFARAYLSWDARDPEAHAQSLGAFLDPSADPDAGLTIPATGRQQITWSQAEAERSAGSGLRVVTVAAETGAGQLLHLAVGVRRRGSALALAGYPALVSRPDIDRRDPEVTDDLADVGDSATRAVVTRALRNYLAGDEANLRADVANGAQITPPARGLRLDNLERLQWLSAPKRVRATVSVTGRSGLSYVLSYGVVLQRGDDRVVVLSIELGSRE